MLYHLSHRNVLHFRLDCSSGLCIMCHADYIGFKKQVHQELYPQRAASGGAVVEPWLSRSEVHGSSPGEADVYFVPFCRRMAILKDEYARRSVVSVQAPVA